MNIIRKSTLLCLALVIISSCGFDIGFGSGQKGNGEIVNETRDVTEDFTAIAASEGLEVYVKQGEDYYIEVEADENIIELIGTDIRNGRLKIHAIENIGQATKKVYVTLPEITVLKSSSGANLRTEGMFKADRLEIDSSSGSILAAEFTANALELEASSGANLSISGSSDTANIDVSSGGNINAKELQVKVCHAEASSGGNIKIHVLESLTADAGSGGNISYSGEPDVQKKKSVSGSVSKY